MTEALDDVRQGIDAVAFAVRHLDRALRDLGPAEGAAAQLARLPGLRAALDAVAARADPSTARPPGAAPAPRTSDPRARSAARP